MKKNIFKFYLRNPELFPKDLVTVFHSFLHLFFFYAIEPGSRLMGAPDEKLIPGTDPAVLFSSNFPSI